MSVSFDLKNEDEQISGYTIDGADIEAVRVKGASDALAREADSNIRFIANRLQRGEIDAAEFYASMQREVKMLHMGQASLSRGGVDAMRPADWKRVENVVAEQFGGVEGKFPGLRAFAKDVSVGRYGNAGELQEQVLNRAGMYADAGRGTFENERLAARMELYPLEARRVRGALDGCRDCVAWAGLGWISAEQMQSDYPIGNSVCGARCHCVIVTRRDRKSTANEIKTDVKFHLSLEKLVRTMRAATAPVALVASVFFVFMRLAALAKYGVALADTVLTSTIARSGYLHPSKITDAVRDGVAPALRHPFRPVGTAVGRAVEIEDGSLQFARDAIDALDSVHGDGQLKTIFVDALRGSPKRGEWTVAQYYDGEPSSIGLHPKGPTPLFSMIHEGGHWLHDKTLGGLGGSGLGGFDFSGGAQLERALNQSQSIKNLRRLQSAKKKIHRASETRGKTVDYDVNLPFVDYLLEPDEMFARAYAQYIAMRSGHGELRRELASKLIRAQTTPWGGMTKDTLHYFEQWDEEDFSEIANAFDKLLLSKGWIKRA